MYPVSEAFLQAVQSAALRHGVFRAYFIWSFFAVL
jgi:hypothetical protein